jgi:hypothetical protein
VGAAENPRQLIMQNAKTVLECALKDVDRAIESGAS